MAPRTAKPYFVILALLGLTSIALAVGVDISLADQAGVNPRLPDSLGTWTGNDMRFCQKKECQAQFLANTLTNREVCPTCSTGKLDSLTFVERGLLPADTEGMRSRYTAPDGRQIIANIVLSGKERASIHRPEVCLSGQGSTIVGSETIQVPLAGREPLDVRVLSLLQERKGPGGEVLVQHSYYAYWFTGKDRETASHIQRMWWMATDRIFHNLAHRWAYIAVAGTRKDGTKDHLADIRETIALLHPAITLK